MDQGATDQAEKARGEAARSRAEVQTHTRAVFHRLFECAMRWRYLEVQHNPMSLIERIRLSKP
jgi:hypothetical protein